MESKVAKAIDLMLDKAMESNDVQALINAVNAWQNYDQYLIQKEMYEKAKKAEEK